MVVVAAEEEDEATGRAVEGGVSTRNVQGGTTYSVIKFSTYYNSTYME